MPPTQLNSPSSRMGRVLDDFDSLEAAYVEMATAFASVAPGEFIKLSPTPSKEAVINEKARRQYTLGKVANSREYMRRRRGKDDSEAPRTTRHTTDATAPISAEDLAKAIDGASDHTAGDD